MDKMRFAEARRKLLEKPQSKGIGTLGEKTVHAVLKEYYGGGEENKEIPLGGFVADVVSEDGVIEIQTRALYRLERKLEALLPLCRVTVVYPIEARKYLLDIDPDSGELISKRLSPKRVKIWHGIAELYGIRKFLGNENLTVRFPVLTVEETRIRATEKKRRADKIDKLPSEMTEEVVIRRKEDIAALLPEELPDEFTSAEFAKLCRINADTAGKCIRVLSVMGIITECGKQGRCKLWKKTEG
ncbi:hypothetical protein RASY3_11080 [Ruminococcus albus SY3]|uniref:DUF8091 domain-containing protein n=1 Tax=Ruminococcus albus SY3 TaxID=1341156 RepID=A0A011VW98_RUMAL|nr:hypothetical protein [Ruminococcus albus]EXM38402.1 hypothetical protein RASY3_19770 [Ruminococcus albus SY3]EXM38873.1 hypothetical protein RASY3_11080 [Ruminococcus albus SY3]